MLRHRRPPSADSACDELRARVDLPLTRANGELQGLFFTFHLVINELSAYETFKIDDLFGLAGNLSGLQASAEASGKHPIFLCICGYPSCASVWVDCEVSESVVTWKGLHAYDELSGRAGRRLAQCHYCFSLQAYRAVIASLEEFIAVYGRAVGPVLLP